MNKCIINQAGNAVINLDIIEMLYMEDHCIYIDTNRNSKIKIAICSSAPEVNKLFKSIIIFLESEDIIFDISSWKSW